MQNEQIQPVLDYLDKIATKIGSTAEQVWPWLVRQQYVEAFYSAAILLLFTIGITLSIRSSMKVDWNDGNPKMWIALFALVIFGTGFLISTITFIIEFGDVFNPEYWALMDLLNSVR